MLLNSPNYLPVLQHAFQALRDVLIQFLQPAQRVRNSLYYAPNE